MIPRASIRGILLAAGSSSRFGADKLLHPLPPDSTEPGVPIAVASARHLAEALPTPLAVVRPGAPALEVALAEAGCEVLVCPHAADGMGTSLAFAIGAAREAYGWVVALADMPFIRPQTISLVADWVADGAVIAAPSFQGERGHPVGMTEWVRDELLALRGDEGARRILKKHAGSIQLIPVSDPGVLRDIDVPRDVTEPRIYSNS